MKNRKKTAAALALFSALTLLAAPACGEGRPFPPCPCESFRAALCIDESLRPVRLAVNTQRFVDYDEGEEVLRSSRTIVSFTGAPAEFNGEALQSALWDYSTHETEEHQRIRDNLIDLALEVREKGAKVDSCSRHLTDVFIRRADTAVVSLLETSYDFRVGAVHGISGVSGRNFDARTGEELTMDDVFTDKLKLADVIVAHLRRDYPNASFMKGGGMPVEEAVNMMTGVGNIPWTLDPCGASFYFNPYVIGSYAEGIFTVTLLFREHPELFRDEYRRAPSSYTMELRPHLPVRTAFADGSDTTLKVTTTDGGIRIYCGGAMLDDWGESSGLRPVLVALADGRRYLYTDDRGPGEAWETTRVFDLNGDAPLRVPMKRRMTRRANVDENFAEAEIGPVTIDENENRVFYIMADPEDFNMTLLDEATGKARRCECRVGGDGTPEITWAEDAG